MKGQLVLVRLLLCLVGRCVQFLGVFLVSGLCVLQARDGVLLRERGEIQFLLRVRRALVLHGTCNFRRLPLKRRVVPPDEVVLLSL